MLTYDMDARGDATLYEYLYACIRADIERGAIAPDQRLPSKRALARHLGVSVITVEGAYAQLAAEGYVYSRERSGVFASRVVPAGAKPAGGRGVLPACRRSASGSAGGLADGAGSGHPCPPSDDASGQQGTADADAWQPASPPAALLPATTSSSSGASRLADFTGGARARGVFPYDAWARATREVLSGETEESLLAEGSPMGSPRLRRALAGYLRQTRGMAVDPAQILVGAGAQVLYNLVVQLVGRSRTYAVEDPGYPRLTRIYHANGVAHLHVPLDAEGVRVDALAASGADVVHVMPSHQFPTGIVTSAARRYELLGWAAHDSGRLIIEDDYDFEFRLAGRPVPALQSMDVQGCVIYTNTFSKSLGPMFRVGYAVLPPELAERYASELGFYSCTVSTIEQLALARFIERGDYERHVNRVRTRCRSVRSALLAELRERDAAGALRAEATEAGLHFLLGARPGSGAGGARGEEALARAARERGVALAPLSSYCQAPEVRDAPGGGVLVPDRAWFVMDDAGLDPERAGDVAQVRVDVLG